MSKLDDGTVDLDACAQRLTGSAYWDYIRGDAGWVCKLSARIIVITGFAYYIPQEHYGAIQAAAGADDVGGLTKAIRRAIVPL